MQTQNIPHFEKKKMIQDQKLDYHYAISAMVLKMGLISTLGPQDKE